MKILFADNSLYSFLNFRGFVVSHFFNKGYDVNLIVSNEDCNKDILEKVPSYLKVYTVDFKRAGANPWNDFKYICSIFKIIRSVKPDIIFLYTIKPNIYGTIVAKILKIPAVTVVAGLGYSFKGDNLIQKFARRLYKYSLRKSDVTIVLNQSNYNRLISDGYVEDKRLILFECGEGVDFSKFYYSPSHFDKINFLMIARVLYDKGYSEYVEAAKIVKSKYPEIECELLGWIDEESLMGVPRKIVEEDISNGNIKYLGVTDDVPSILCKEDVVLVIPSKYYEGLNRSLMEGCAMGKPLISTNIPGCKETIEEGVNGFLVPPGDAKSLANAMIRFIELPIENKLAMSEASYHRAKNLFDSKLVLKKYDEIISRLLPNAGK